MVNYRGSGPWRTYLPKAVHPWMYFEDLTIAVDAVLAHDGVLTNRIVNGYVSARLGYPLYLTGGHGDEEVWKHWFRDTPHTVHIPAFKPRPHLRDLYVHSWQPGRPTS